MLLLFNLHKEKSLGNTNYRDILRSNNKRWASNKQGNDVTTREIERERERERKREREKVKMFKKNQE